jgi:hypothetical protein
MSNKRIFKGDSKVGNFFRNTYGTGLQGVAKGVADVAGGGKRAGVSGLRKVINKISGRGREAPKPTTPRKKDEEELTRTAFKKGGKVRGAGIATQGVRPAKMVKMKGS